MKSRLSMAEYFELEKLYDTKTMQNQILLVIGLILCKLFMTPERTMYLTLKFLYTVQV
jgi:hypothetical protein